VYAPVDGGGRLHGGRGQVEAPDAVLVAGGQLVSQGLDDLGVRVLAVLATHLRQQLEE